MENMTTKELTDRLVDDLCSEIPIEFDGDEQGVRDEMNAIIYKHVERYRQQIVDKACKYLCKTCNVSSSGAILEQCKYNPCYRFNGFRKAMLNEK